MVMSFCPNEEAEEGGIGERERERENTKLGMRIAIKG